MSRALVGPKFKVVGKHTPNCYAAKEEAAGRWFTCWGPPPWRQGEKPIIRTTRKYGRGSRTTEWLVFVCNCTECPAQLHVQTDFILRAVKEAQP